jgi:hypothetical protein
MTEAGRRLIASLPMGFLTVKELAALRQTDPLVHVLVRCGCGRFLAPAQDVEHFCAIIHRDGRDYVRDWCIPSGVFRACQENETVWIRPDA